MVHYFLDIQYYLQMTSLRPVTSQAQPFSPRLTDTSAALARVNTLILETFAVLFLNFFSAA